MVCCMTRSKVKVTEVRNVRKCPISNAVSSASMHVIKRLTVNYDTPRQCLILIGHTVDIYPRLASRDLQT